jgi:hypothetical protein
MADPSGDVILEAVHFLVEIGNPRHARLSGMLSIRSYGVARQRPSRRNQDHYAAFVLELTAITWQPSSAASDVRLWHLADIPKRSTDVCFEGVHRTLYLYFCGAIIAEN